MHNIMILHILVYACKARPKSDKFTNVVDFYAFVFLFATQKTLIQKFYKLAINVAFMKFTE